jgi:hypothetical protein
MRARLALESARLEGEPTAERAELDELVALYQELRLDGFGQALAKMRGVYGV